MNKTVILLTCYFPITILNIFTSQSYGQKSADNSVRLIDKNVTYELPKAYELMHIAMALTDTAIVSKGYNVYNEIIDTTSDYYRDVLSHFAAFSNHKLIMALNKSLQKNPSNYVNNLVLAYNSKYQAGDLKKIRVMPWIRRVVYSTKGVKRKYMKDFSKVTQFEKFYKNHQEYYKEALENSKRYADVKNQQIWLEQHFSKRYDKYNIVISPLMYGTHFTQRFKFQGMRTCIMWVALPDIQQSFSENIKAGRYTGVVMTEIDHNYVNPVSDEFKKELNKIMGDEHRTKWTGGSYSNSYKTGYKVFNEYMTHAVYLLYTNQKYNTNEQQALESAKIGSMVNTRKFITFGNFYTELKRIYQNKESGETIETLYPDIIEWCKQQNGQ